MKGSVKFLACLLYWTNLYIAKATVRAHVESRDKCAGYEALYPTIFEQLAPFFGGITQEQVDKASMHYAADWDTGPKHAHTKFNISAAQTLPPQHPDYPWSSYALLKIVSLDGTLYLPGGLIPLHRAGYTFSATQGTSSILTDILSVADKYGPFPDFEFFVFGSDFPLVKDLGEDNTTFPVFGGGSSRRTYDLILPESSTTAFHKSASNFSIRWEDRPNKAVGRYNAMCHRGGPSMKWRPGPEKHGCVRFAFHDLDKSELNSDGLLDVGLYSGVEDPKPWASTEYLNSAKFRLVLDGASIANRLPEVLRNSGQVILLEDFSPNVAHWYAALQPWVHYVPIGRENYEDIFDVLKFLIKHDDLAQNIARQGRDFGLRYLHPVASECYTKKMFQELSALYTYKPRSPGTQAVTLRHALEVVEKDRVWMNENPEPED